MSANLSKLLGNTRNKRSIVKPVLINTELGSIRNDIALKDTTVRPDATVMATNFKAVNNAQRIAEAFGVVGRGMQDMAKGEIDKARIDYAERKQAEAEAKQAAREAEANAKQQRTDDAKLMLLKMMPKMLADNKKKYKELASADDFEPENYYSTISNDIEELTKGASREHLNVFFPLLSQMEADAFELGENRIKSDVDKNTTSDLLGLIQTNDIAPKVWNDSLSTIKNQFISTGRSDEEFEKLKSRSLLSQAQQSAESGDVSEIERINLLSSSMVDVNSTEGLILQKQLFSALQDAKRMKSQIIQDAEKLEIQETTKEIEPERDVKKLRELLKETSKIKTNGDLALMSKKNARSQVINQRITTLENINNGYSPLLHTLNERLLEKIKPSQVKGQTSVVGKDAGVLNTIGANGNYVMQKADVDEVMVRIADRAINYAVKNNLSADSPEFKKALYSIQADETQKWNIGNLNPDLIIDREFKDLDIDYYDTHADVLQKRFYTNYKNAQSNNQNLSNFINKTFPLTGDVKRDKELRFIRNSLFYNAVQRSRSEKLQEPMSEKEMANQGDFFVDAGILNQQKTRLQELGLGGWEDMSQTTDIEDVNLHVLDNVKEIGKEIGNIAYTIMPGLSLTVDDPPEFSFQYDVPFTLNQIKAADKIVIKESKGKRTLKTMGQEEAINVLERLRAEGELDAQKLVNNILTDRNVKLENDNQKLKQDNETIKLERDIAVTERQAVDDYFVNDNQEKANSNNADLVVGYTDNSKSFINQNDPAIQELMKLYKDK